MAAPFAEASTIPPLPAAKGLSTSYVNGTEGIQIRTLEKRPETEVWLARRIA
jgi:hypothetical protein